MRGARSPHDYAVSVPELSRNRIFEPRRHRKGGFSNAAARPKVMVSVDTIIA